MNIDVDVLIHGSHAGDTVFAVGNPLKTSLCCYFMLVQRYRRDGFRYICYYTI